MNECVFVSMILIIVIELEVTVLSLESGEELTSFHHVVKAELIEGKYSHLRDFIRGT